MRTIALGALLLSSLCACSTYRDDLARGQTAFEQNNHERALALFRALEVDTGELSLQERGHYAYLRGMTDFRIGYRADARHWLLVAQAIEKETPGTLNGDWKARLTEALTELNGQVYQGGIESLTNTGKPQSDEPAPKKKAKSEDEP
jgi:hypothetical protein